MKKIFAALVSLLMILGMAAPTMADTASSSANVGNVAPVVLSKTEYPNPVDLNPAGTVDVTITATVSDPNGNGEITSVQYQFDGGGWVYMYYDGAGTATATLTLPYTTSPGYHTIGVQAWDSSGFGSDILWNTDLWVNTLLSLDLDFSAVNFGTVTPGTPSPVTPGNINNVGNIATNVYESAAWYYPASGFITQGTVGYTGPLQIDGGAYFYVGIPVGGGSTAAFDLTVPLGTASGTYSGTITIDVFS